MATQQTRWDTLIRLVLVATALAVSGCGSGTGASTNSGTGTTTTNGAYTLSSGLASKTGSFASATDDQSAILVSDTGKLTLTDAVITTSGQSSSSDDSNFYGLNAGVLAQSGGAIALTGGSVTTTGAGANGIFAYGSASAISVSGTTVDCTGQYAHGIMCSGGGTITATNLDVRTTGGSSAPVATDRGGGTITVSGGTYWCSGSNSPGLYSTGALIASGATFTATGSEVAVIEGSNTIALTNCALTTSKAGKWGVMLYQSMSGDAEGAQSTYTQTGGSLSDTAADSPLFYVTNTEGTVDLAAVSVSAASGVLLKAAAGSWGTPGANGGTAILNASGQALAGNLLVDAISSLAVTLRNGSTLTGAINAAGTAGSTSLTLETSSTWTVTADSHLTSVIGATISGTAITNINGGGHTVTYNASSSANSYLGGLTYTLAGGGTLAPAF